MHTQQVPSIQAVKRAVFRADKEKAKGYSYVYDCALPGCVAVVKHKLSTFATTKRSLMPGNSKKPLPDL